MSREEFIQFINERVKQLLRATVSARISLQLVAYSNTLIGAIKGYLVILDKKQLRVEWKERGSRYQSEHFGKQIKIQRTFHFLFIFSFKASLVSLTFGYSYLPPGDCFCGKRAEMNNSSCFKFNIYEI